MADNKARYWVAVMYPENMLENWQNVIAEKLQRPYEYCIHSACQTKEGEDRKTHVHIILVYGSPTTYKNALSVFRELEKPGCVAISKCERVIGMRYMHDYLIHDTDNARKQGKHLYSPNDRISGNGFDIGAYEQISLEDKLEIKKNISLAISENRIFNFYDLNTFVIENMDNEAYEVFTQHQNYFANLVRGYYNKVYTKMVQHDKIFNDFLDNQDAENHDTEALRTTTKDSVTCDECQNPLSDSEEKQDEKE